MKLSETLLESLNDIDAVYLEKSEKEYGWLHRYRRQLTAVLSLSAVLVLFTVLTPKPQSMDAGSYATVPAESSESMKQDESVYDSMETETAGTITESYVIRLQDENGNELSDAALQEVYEALLAQDLNVWIDEQGSLVIAGNSEELKVYLDQLAYSYELVKQ